MRLTKEQNKIIDDFIISSIDFSDYAIGNNEKTEIQLKNVYNTFLTEKGNYYLDKSANLQLVFADWLSGLPTCVNLPFSYFDIGLFVKSYYHEVTEKELEHFQDNYWNFMTMRFFKLFKKYKIEVKK